MDIAVQRCSGEVKQRHYDYNCTRKRYPCSRYFNYTLPDVRTVFVLLQASGEVLNIESLTLPFESN